MKLKVLIVTTASLVVGLSLVLPAIASDNSSLKDNIRGERHSVQDKERLESLAKQYGVSLDRKSLRAAQQEIRAKMIQDKASELGIATEGKTLEELEAAIKSMFGDKKQVKEKNAIPNIREYRASMGNRKQLLVEKAKELGIQTENKDIESIQQEILHHLLKTKAEELGIDVKGKDPETIKSLLEKASGSRN